MRKLWGATALLLGSTSFVYAQEATVEKIHDTPAVKESIIANLLQEHDNPFTLYPYESNYLLYTYTSNINKQAISSHEWANNAK